MAITHSQVKVGSLAGLLTGSESFPNVDFGDWLVNDLRIAPIQPPEIVGSALRRSPAESKDYSLPDR